MQRPWLLFTVYAIHLLNDSVLNAWFAFLIGAPIVDTCIIWRRHAGSVNFFGEFGSPRNGLVTTSEQVCQDRALLPRHRTWFEHVHCGAGPNCSIHSGRSVSVVVIFQHACFPYTMEVCIYR